MKPIVSNKKLFSAFHFAILIIAFLFMSYIAVEQWRTLQKIGWHFHYILLISSIIGVATLIFICVYGWHLILIKMGQTITYKTSLLIWLISFPTRYIPGGIWSYATRTSLAKTKGIRIAVSITSMYIETLLVIVSSITIGIFAFFLLVVEFPIRLEIVILIWIVAGLLLHPKIIAPLLRIITRKAYLADVYLPDVKTIFVLFTYYTAYWILCSGIFLCFVLSIYSVQQKDWISVGASFTLCYFIGFIAFFAPSGIGVRESALYIMLSPILPHDVNLLVSTGSRLWLIAGEILFIFMTYLFKETLEDQKISIDEFRQKMD